MTGVFFDSNILVYTIDQDDRRRHVAQALVATGGVISVQCLNEFVSVAHRKLRLSWESACHARDEILVLCPIVVPLTVDLHRHGMDLAERYRLSVYDGLIAAAALAGGCSILYSEDMHHDLSVDGRLRIVNPFA